MDYTDKAEFYSELRRDFYDRRPEDRKGSFIYRYRKALKDRKVSLAEYERIKNKERKDPYVLLRSCYEGWKSGDIDGAELCSVLSTLSETDIPEADARQVYDELCERLILEDVRNFFYDAGYNTKAPDTAAPAVRKNNRSRSDEALDMLFEYEKYKRSKGAASAENAPFENRLSDDAFLHECDDLFELLNDIEIDENQYVFIPVMIDPESGLGIYIVGKALLDPLKEYDRNCYYCCVRFSCDETDAGRFGEYCAFREENFEEYQFNIPYRLEGDHYSDLKSAILEFKKQKNGSSDLVGYDILNEPLSAEIEDSDIDYFLKYFVEPEEMSAARKRKKELERSKRSLYVAMRDRAIKKQAERPDV